MRLMAAGFIAVGIVPTLIMGTLTNWPAAIVFLPLYALVTFYVTFVSASLALQIRDQIKKEEMGEMMRQHLGLVNEIDDNGPPKDYSL